MEFSSYSEIDGEDGEDGETVLTECPVKYYLNSSG